MWAELGPDRLLNGEKLTQPWHKDRGLANITRVTYDNVAEGMQCFTDEGGEAA